MSSLRNSIQRRPHKERSQPNERAKWGLLEKHKDYSLRAKDYNAKKAQLAQLRQKAAERNPDEFHFAMLRHRMVAGGKTARRSEYGGMTQATSALLKTQDAGYLRTMLQTTRRQRARLVEEVLMLQRLGTEGAIDDASMTGKGKERVRGSAKVDHIVFVEDEAAQEACQPISKKRRRMIKMGEEEDEEQGLQRNADEGDNARADEQRNTMIAAKQKKLDVLRMREEALLAAEQELEIQRARMGNSIGGTTKTGHIFKIKERKR